MELIFDKLNRFFSGKWQIAILDLQAGRWVLEPKTSYIPYLKAENANGRHILIRPPPETEPYYLLADDLTWPLIQRHHKYSDGTWKYGRMVVETSPSNYQIWIRSSRPLSLEEKRYWLKRLCSDPGADPKHRWGRCPGFRNRKEKHRDCQGGYPLSRLIWIDWKRNADISPSNNMTPDNVSAFSPEPLGGACHNKNISRKDYERGDESATDFSYAMALMRRRFTDEEIRKCLISERRDWENHQGEKRMNDYIKRAIAKARAIVQNS
jgi:hypothetical protein